MAPDRQMLETQANQIESVLAHHRIAAYVAGGVVAPRFIQFQIVANMGTRVNKVASLAEEIALALGCRTAVSYTHLTLPTNREV